MNNYALDTPIKRKLYVPKDDVPFAPVVNPPLVTETDSTHRSLTWLFHKPQDSAIFPVQPKSARLDKKK
jgi:hypothetical protein